MIIGFNAQRLAGQRLGVGRYLEYMVSHWSTMLNSSERVRLYLREPLSDRDRGRLRLPASIEPRLLRPNMSGLAWENLVLPTALVGVDVLFGPSYTLPVAYRGKAVVAIHSANEIMAGSHSWLYGQTYSRIHRFSGHRADRVIVPCETTAADVVRAYGVPAARMDVIPQGADDAFRPINDEAARSATRRQLLGDDVPYVLFTGKLSQRRNIPALIEAFARAKRRRGLPHKLLLFGPNHLGLPLDELAGSFEIAGSVVQMDGRVDDHRELVPIYNAADIFVNPSRYEGWSMTTMEAMACGTAVIASKRGGLGEEVGDHGFTVEDPTPEALGDAMEQVLTDDGLRRELARKARERGSQFTWHDTTLQTLEVLRRVAA